MPGLEFSPEARADLLELYRLMLAEGGAARAGGYLARIERRCATLTGFSQSGREQPDVGLGVRSLGFERRVSIAYQVIPDAILILRILYAGRVT